MHKHGAALLLACSLVAASSSADEVHGTRSEKLVERKHEATVTMHPGWASVLVHRTVHNGGERHDQAMFWIDVPQGAVAVGLRTLGSLAGKPHWFAGDLMEAEEAAAKYLELTGIGGYYPKDPALLSWRHQNQLALQVFPVAPSQPKTVEYTYTLPTEYRQGAHHLVLPRMGTELLPASLQSNAPIEHEPDGTVDIALSAKGASRIGGALAVVPFAEGRVLTRYRIEAAPRLSKAPRGASVVIALDNSRSIDDAARQAQVAAARAYLAHLDDAYVQVLVFDREVRARHKGFVKARQALADLQTLKLDGKNGSEVESALLEAEALLARRRAPKRILLLTDTLTKEALNAARLRASVSSTAILHVGMVDVGDPAVARDDDHDWTAMTRPTGGLVWNASASLDAQAADSNRRVFEEWVRPLRIDHLSLSAPRVQSDIFVNEGALVEGEGLTQEWIADAATPWLKVEGELWTEPVRVQLEPDADEGKRWSALVFGSTLLNELDETEMMTLAKRGGAVSPVTSYLAIEPGVRPSTEGLEIGEAFGAGGLGLSGVGVGGGGASRPGNDEAQAWLARELGAAWKSCGGQRGTAISIETTLREVVEVAERVEGQKGDEATASACLRKAAWELQPPDMFGADRWNRWRVPLSAEP